MPGIHTGCTGCFLEEKQIEVEFGEGVGIFLHLPEYLEWTFWAELAVPPWILLGGLFLVVLERGTTKGGAGSLVWPRCQLWS